MAQEALEDIVLKHLKTIKWTINKPITMKLLSIKPLKGFQYIYYNQICQITE